MFTDVVVQTLAFEGGYSNHENDRGGQTQFGITFNTLNSLKNLDDGLIGPVTVTSVDRVYAAMGHLLINAICDRRALFYQRICTHDEAQVVFLQGWLRRAQAFKVEGAYA